MKKLSPIKKPFAGFPAQDDLNAFEGQFAIVGVPYQSPYANLPDYSTLNAPEVVREQSYKYSQTDHYDFDFDGEMQPDVALDPEYEELYPFSKIVGKANILIMPGQHSAAISYKMMKTLGDTKVIGPLLIGLGLPIEIAPLRSSTSELINLASIAAYSADIIDYKK